MMKYPSQSNEMRAYKAHVINYARMRNMFKKT